MESIATHNGKITIKSPTGQHRTFCIKTQKDDANFAPGERIISLLDGPDNENDYKQFGFVKEGGLIVVWRKYRGSVGDNGYEPSAYERYAKMLMHVEHYERLGAQYMFATSCRRCNRTLTTPESIQSGIGPICAGRA